MGKRRKGREIVLQSLYASLISGADLMDVLDDQILRRSSAAESADFARELAGKIKLHRVELDRRLKGLISKNRDHDRLGTLEIVILTIGLAELEHSPDVPYRVVINEALDLAHRYCEDGAVGFVNGVLDKAAAGLKPPAADSPDLPAAKDDA